MAAADYKLCDLCDAKTFYDVEIDYRDGRADATGPLPSGVGAWKVLCERCAKTHHVLIEERRHERL